MSDIKERAGVEDHSDDPDCIGQWCCGCNTHPVGKPWGWNSDAWNRHFEEVPHE